MTNPGQPQIREVDTTHLTLLRLRMEDTSLRMERRDDEYFTGSAEWISKITFGDGRLRPLAPMEPVHRSLNGSMW